jgi:hypothetical protein
MEDATIFINYINDHYKEVGDTLKILSAQRHQRFDEDAYHESIIRCHKAITKKGKLDDKSPYGITSYLIRSYFNLVLENKRACVNSKRDMNYDDDNIGELQEEWSLKNQVDAKQKILGDMFKDFSVLYIMMIVENNFDSEHFYLFRLKQLQPGMTYKKLAEVTQMKGVRQKVVEVKKFIQQNVTKEMIRKEFYDIYGDII